MTDKETRELIESMFMTFVVLHRMRISTLAIEFNDNPYEFRNQVKALYEKWRKSEEGDLICEREFNLAISKVKK